MGLSCQGKYCYLLLSKPIRRIVWSALSECDILVVEKNMYKTAQKVLFLALLCSFLGMSVYSVQAVMEGGDYEIYADTFSSIDGSAVAGGGYQIYQTSGEGYADNYTQAVTGQITASGTLFGIDEVVYISDGSTTTRFLYINLGGGNSGYCYNTNTFNQSGQPCVNNLVLIDIGGGCDFDPVCLANATYDAMVSSSEKFLMSVSTSTNATVNLTNANPDATGNVAITDEVADANYIVSGMTISGDSYILKAGFQAMEKGSVTMTLSTSSLSFGTLSESTLTTSSIIATVTSDTTTGYGVTVSEDTNLCIGGVNCTLDANNIDDIVVAPVAAGSEGYGMKTSGGAGLLAADTAITSDGVATINSGTDVTSQQTTILFSVAIDAAQTIAGAYSHTVTVTATANP